MTKIKEIIQYLESLAPPAYQEGYDNANLLTGNKNDVTTGVLVTLDCTEAVVGEAIKKDCNLIIAHHPIIFKGLKSLTGKNYIERTVIRAIKNDIAIYAIHTNLDNVHIGVNQKIGEKMGIRNPRILSPKKEILSKLVAFVPKENRQNILDALYARGAGDIGNYSHCSFTVTGTGTFLPSKEANPLVGSVNNLEETEEDRIEVILPSHMETTLVDTLKKVHPYEEVAYYLSKLENENQQVGSGMIGELEEPIKPLYFLEYLKEKMQLDCVRYTKLPEKEIKKVAWCGGAGSFLLNHAIRQGADVFITGDFKYHEFFDADEKIVIADIGHYESEVFTKDLLYDILTKKFTTFAVNLSETVTNPISYL